MERRNPLPPGRYWQDIFQSNWDAFHAWLATNKDSVHVDTTESFDSAAAPDMSSQTQAREFYIFTVSVPVQWDQTHWGFPTIADAGVKSSADTVDRPPPELNPLDALSNALPSAQGLVNSITTMVFVALAVLVVVVVSKHRPAGLPSGGALPK
jgi:hypothetical protein